MFAFCAGGDVVVIDPADLDAPLVSIPCGGKLEYGRADGTGRIFANNEDTSEIVVIDSKALRVTAHWPVAPATAPTGLAIDLVHHRLFSVGDNQKMAIVDYENGKLVATVAIGPRRRRLRVRSDARRGPECQWRRRHGDGGASKPRRASSPPCKH